MLIFALLLVFAFGIYVMTPAERTRVLRSALAILQRLKLAAIRGPRDRGPFWDALRARTQWAFVTPILAALNVTIFMCMLFTSGALDSPEMLVAWGGNFGPRTTNGEWWRLLTTTFVHSGMIQLLVNLACLIQIGLILERLVGHVTLAFVYISSAVAGSLVSLAGHPVAVNDGASSAIFGLCGLLVASWTWGVVHRSTLTIPLTAARRFGPAVAMFLLYNVAYDGFSLPELAGLLTGTTVGLFLTRQVSDRKPAVVRLASASLTVTVMAVGLAVPQRGVTDVRPEIIRVAAVEERTAGAYGAAVDKFKLGRITAKALAHMIDRTIIPELQAAHDRLKTIGGVPREHERLMAGAEEYFRLRDESWRLRSDALQKANMLALRQADGRERASLDALRRITTVNQD